MFPNRIRKVSRERQSELPFDSTDKSDDNSFDLDARRGIVARKAAESYAPMLLGAHSSILLPLRKVIVKDFNPSSWIESRSICIIPSKYMNNIASVILSFYLFMFQQLGKVPDFVVSLFPFQLPCLFFLTIVHHKEGRKEGRRAWNSLGVTSK